MVSKGLTQAYEVQDLAYQAIMQFKKDRTNSSGELVLGKFDSMKLAQLVKSWEIAQERVRINRNKPLPGSLRPDTQLKRVRVRRPANVIDVTYPQQLQEPTSADPKS